MPNFSSPTSAPHPHDPHADALTWQQAADLLRYLAPDPNRMGGTRMRLHHASPTHCALFEDTRIVAYGSEQIRPYRSAVENALRNAGLWPDEQLCPPPPRYVAVRTAIMLGSECVATATTGNFAHRIASALNWYKPGRRGS